MEGINLCAVRQQDADTGQIKNIQDNDQTGNDVRRRNLGTDKKRGGIAGESRDENVALDTRSLAESQEKKRRHQKNPGCGMHNGQGERGKDAVVWARHEKGRRQLHQKIMNAELYGCRSRRRQKKRWSDMIE